jgi:uncharacterized protein YdaU (DUF1376 family)
VNKPPAFLTYARDWLADGAELSLAEQGAIAMLRAYAWHEGSIPDDDVKLARLLRVIEAEFAAVRGAVRARTIIGAPGRLVFADLEEQRAELAARRAEQARKSALGVAARQAKRQPVGEPAGSPVEQPGGYTRGFTPRFTSASASASASASSSPPALAPAEEAQKEIAPADAVATPFELVPGGLVGQKRAARARKAKRPDREPLPFRAAEALQHVAAGAGDQFTPPDSPKRGHAIALEQVIHRYPTPKAWTVLGAYIAATEGWRVIDVGLVVKLAGDRMAAAAAWDEKGRPPIGRNGARTNGATTTAAVRQGAAGGEVKL